MISSSHTSIKGQHDSTRRPTVILVRINVTLKPTVNDPQGKTILEGLRGLGFTLPSDVRAGKYLEMTLSTDDFTIAEQQTISMCDQLLANTVIEKYEFDLTSID